MPAEIFVSPELSSTYVPASRGEKRGSRMIWSQSKRTPGSMSTRGNTDQRSCTYALVSVLKVVDGAAPEKTEYSAQGEEFGGTGGGPRQVAPGASACPCLSVETGDRANSWS